MKLKGLNFADAAEIQEALTDELKKVQKEEFSAAFQKLRSSKKKYICVCVCVCVCVYIYIYIYIYIYMPMELV
jgi:hypothetical protein